MTLHAIVAALGGDLSCGGARANIPAPGHSPSDRSVSLLLSGDRLIVHSFGAAAWTAVRDHLRALGLIDGEGRLLNGARRTASSPADLRPDRPARIATARRLWEDAGPITPPTLSHRHLAVRAVGANPCLIRSLRHHGAAPLSVYRSGGPRRPALVAAIAAPDGALTAVELTYLAAGGRRDERLRAPRKMVGLVPPGSAVRLAPASVELLVGEGVMSVLSASERLAVPAWALLSAHNLAAWSPPPETRRVVVAADRGAPGESAADRLLARLQRRGVRAVIALPPGDAEDWNAFAIAQRRKEGS